MNSALHARPELADATVASASAPAASPTPLPGVAHACLQQVTRYFDKPGAKEKFHALGPIDLTLNTGEFFSVVGPSGCGKSTLLDVLAGLAEPSSGSAWFEGKPVKGVPDGVGVVFQEDASFPWLTVRDNIAFGLRWAGVDGAEVQRRVDYAIGFMGLKDFAKAYPSQLSGGMRQRVCIARTLVTQPRLILLDEPFGALDPQTRLLMGDELLRLWRETSATVLLITHALDEAAMLSDRVGVMSTRPGLFIDFVETGWERERDSRVVSTPHFGQINARLWDKLRVESMKSMGVGGGGSN
jgi:NitT/TauT family transport system ATP-binding protein